MSIVYDKTIIYHCHVLLHVCQLVSLVTKCLDRTVSSSVSRALYAVLRPDPIPCHMHLHPQPNEQGKRKSSAMEFHYEKRHKFKVRTYMYFPSSMESC